MVIKFRVVTNLKKFLFPMEVQMDPEDQGIISPYGQTLWE
jgi:hypothetical protein